MDSSADQLKNLNEGDLKEFRDWDFLIINRYPPGGSVYRWSLDLLEILNGKSELINLKFRAKGWEITHIGKDFSPRFSSPFLNHIFLNFSFRQAVTYIERLRNERNNLVLHYTNQFSGTLRVKRIKEIVNVQDSPNYTETDSPALKLYMRQLYNSLRNKEWVVTNTEVLKHELIDFGFTGNIRAIHLPYSPVFKKIDVTKKNLRKELGLPQDKKIIISVSSDLPRKNLSTIREVIKKLGDSYILVRVGTQLLNSITFNGIDDTTLNKLYNASDVLLFPSLYEGFGLPIIESFAAGLPVVTSDIPTIREVAGDAAILVNPKDVDGIAESIKEAVEQREKLISRGLERAVDFSITKFRERILKLYSDVTKGS